MAPWIISLFSPSQDFSFEVELWQEAPCHVSDLHWGSSQYTLGPGRPLLFACGTLSSPGAITAQLKPLRLLVQLHLFTLFAYFRQTLAGIHPHRAQGNSGHGHTFQPVLWAQDCFYFYFVWSFC